MEGRDGCNYIVHASYMWNEMWNSSKLRQPVRWRLSTDAGDVRMPDSIVESSSWLLERSGHDAS
eukprot:19764-Eustigmatos_ZCMA.PRE.1